MIAYLYSLDYHAEDRHLASEIPPPDEAPEVNDSKSTGACGKPFSQQLSTEIDQDSFDKNVGPVEDSPTIFDPLSFHILMYSLADRMFIRGLKTLSKAKVERELLRRLDSNSFPRAIIEIYNSTPASDRGLRDMAVKLTLDHLAELRNGEETAHSAFPDSLVKSVPQFSFDLLVAMMDRTVSDWNEYGLCKKNWSHDTDKRWKYRGKY